MNKVAVSIKNLFFSYKKGLKPVFDHLTLEVMEGQRFGLFGPNGAGKTTLMNCMTGLLKFQQGKIKLFDCEISSNKNELNKLFGLVPQDFSFYQELSPIENLEFFGAWSGLTRSEIKIRINELIEVLNLQSVKKKQACHLSGGMKRRLNLAIGVLQKPKILFLDEPTVGVDVQTRTSIINFLKDLNSSGTTLIYTSHQLNEAEELCDKIALIDDGKIIAHNNLQQLLLEHKQDGLEGLFINLTGKIFKESDV